MSKSNNTNRKLKGFREFIEEDEQKPNPKKKSLRESKEKNHQKIRQKLRNFDINNYSEEDFDDDEWSIK